MITTDPIADFLTRVRNAYLARQSTTTIPHSKLKEQLALILKGAGYLDKVATNSSGPKTTLELTLRYQGKLPALNSIERLSKPGRRLYSQATELKPVLSGQGLTIISTPQGLMTNNQARKAHLGGELLCKVW